MLKAVDKSNISERKFKAYKEWIQTEQDYPVLTAFSETGSMEFNTSTATEAASGTGIYSSPLWHSINARYYKSDGNVFTQAGIVRNPGTFNIERDINPTIYVIQIPQIKYGEQIKKNSIILEDNTNGEIYYDDGFGGITTENTVYTLVSYDADTQDLVLADGETGVEYTIVLSQFDVNSGIGIFSYGGDTDSYIVVFVDFQTGQISLSEEFDFDTLQINPTSRVGNVFYDDGIIVLNTAAVAEYVLRYRSTQEIHETEVLVSVEPGEFNASQNPTAVDVTLFQEYNFETTAITNSKPAGTVKIKEVLDITKREYYTGSIGSSSGSWDDYYESSSLNPTGSYLAPYITTIGLYDENYDMVAVAKLPKPIKNLPDYPINFIIRFDT